MPAYATLTFYDGDKKAKNENKHEWKKDKRISQVKGYLTGAFMEESVIVPGYDRELRCSYVFDEYPTVWAKRARWLERNCSFEASAFF